MSDSVSPSYAPVPLNKCDDSFLTDNEEGKIQKLREIKQREDVEKQTKLKIQQIIEENQKKPKNAFIR